MLIAAAISIVATFLAINRFLAAKESKGPGSQLIPNAEALESSQRPIKAISEGVEGGRVIAGFNLL
ncbi:hypothetical protein [Accumulibacter sp.]|uniref:hypothetical protein n=1 Tax=Accumulibacter sp. TaxID=2053492 RepID=UPI0028C451D4|nr:hypothetical protein [Accumulibacter sp.]